MNIKDEQATDLDAYHAQLRWLDHAVAPLQRKFGLSYAEAEARLADWMRMRRVGER